MYKIGYAPRVIEDVRALIRRNPAHTAVLRAAAADLDRILRVYPQFGEPLSDLSIPGGQRWVATFPPFVVHYAVIEDDGSGRPREVILSRPFGLLPNSGLV